LSGLSIMSRRPVGEEQRTNTDDRSMLQAGRNIVAAAGDPRAGSTDEGSEQATGRGDRGFDPNVNQRPPR
jgi:hypothetical protein